MGHFESSSAIIEHVRELVTSIMQNKFGKNSWTLFSSYRAHKAKLLTLNAKNRNKSAILEKKSAIIDLVRELLISNMRNKFEQDTWNTSQVIAPTGIIIDVKCEKSQ